MRLMLSLALVATAAGCSTASPPATVGVAFSPAEVAWFNQSGGNTIKGSAVLRTVAGDVKTCAGLNANLIPNSTYARARMLAMYGNERAGLLRASSGFKWRETDPVYTAMSRTTVCDPLGNFTFKDVPDGDYFITAQVQWGVPGPYFTSWQGGYLMLRMPIAAGETKEVVLTGG